MSIGDTVKNFRYLKNLSQEKLAERAAICVDTLSDLERNLRTPRPQTLEKIAQALNVHVETLTCNHSSFSTIKSFFGIGKITIAVPSRTIPERKSFVISMEDLMSRRHLTYFLEDMLCEIDHFEIPIDGKWLPPSGPVIAICGPLNSHVTAEALASDPFIVFDQEQATGLWTIWDQKTGQRFVSPMDDKKTTNDETNINTDFAYIGRLNYQGRSLIIIAGIHAIGSLGAVHFLINNLSDIYNKVQNNRFSMVIRSEHNDTTILKSEILCPPRIHP